MFLWYFVPSILCYMKNLLDQKARKGNWETDFKTYIWVQLTWQKHFLNKIHLHSLILYMCIILYKVQSTSVQLISIAPCFIFFL